MNRGVLTSLFLMGALAAQVPVAMRAVGQEKHQQENSDQDRSRYQKQQQHQLWNGDYPDEETVDRAWLKDQQQKYNNQRGSQYRSGGVDYSNEETVDRNWLREHNID